MESIEIFTWTITIVLGICFVFSLLALARKPRDNSKKSHTKSTEK